MPVLAAAAPAAGAISAASAATIALTIASAAASAYAQKKASDFDAAQAEANAQAMKQAEYDANARGLEEGIRVNLAGGVTRGALRLEAGASGIAADTGSNLDVLSDAAMFTELDQQTSKENARREADAAHFQAGNYLAQSGSTRQQGRYRTGSTLLSGATDVAGIRLK